MTPAEIQQALAELLHTKARLEVYEARAAELHNQLEAEAIRRWDAEGVQSHWGIHRLGTAELILEAEEPYLAVRLKDDVAERVGANLARLLFQS